MTPRFLALTIKELRLGGSRMGKELKSLVLVMIEVTATIHPYENIKQANG